MSAYFLISSKSIEKSEQPEGSVEYKASSDARKNSEMTSRESSSRNRISERKGKGKLKTANDRIKKMLRVRWEIYKSKKKKNLYPTEFFKTENSVIRHLIRTYHH